MKESFAISTQLYFGTDNKGADGITFVIQNEGPETLAGAGRIGLTGITPAVGVQFDTFYNVGTADIEADHVAVVVDGRNIQNDLLVDPKPFPDFEDIEDGQYHSAFFIWNPKDQQFLVYWEDSHIPLVSTQVDLQGILGTDYGFIGFTSSTGGSTNQHEACIASIFATVYDPFAPSSFPTGTPSLIPTAMPTTTAPTVTASGSPSELPSVSPSTTSPSVLPSAAPTVEPSNEPSSTPSVSPSLRPSSRPTPVPTTRVPTAAPSPKPTPGPTVLVTFHDEVNSSAAASAGGLLVAATLGLFVAAVVVVF